MLHITSLRTSIRQKRRAITNSNRKTFAKKLSNNCNKLAIFRNCKNVAIYTPNDGEIDTIHIQNFLEKSGLCIYLPVIAGNSVKFAQISNHFKNNRFGIQEPAFTPILSANKMNVIITPLVGFDKYKNRIGMGGGFYDRSLAFRKRQYYYRAPKVYGIAFDCQMVDKLPVQAWDVALDGIITPTNAYL